MKKNFNKLTICQPIQTNATSKLLTFQYTNLFEEFPNFQWNKIPNKWENHVTNVPQTQHFSTESKHSNFKMSNIPKSIEVFEMCFYPIIQLFSSLQGLPFYICNSVYSHVKFLNPFPFSNSSQGICLQLTCLWTLQGKLDPRLMGVTTATRVGDGADCRFFGGSAGGGLSSINGRRRRKWIRTVNKHQSVSSKRAHMRAHTHSHNTVGPRFTNALHHVNWTVCFFLWPKIRNKYWLG